MGVKLLGKMKVHELAKELNLTSKEVIERASKLGIELKSHLSSLEDSDIEKIKGNSGKTKTETKKVKEAPKKEKQETAPVIIRRAVIISDDEINKKEEEENSSESSSSEAE